MTQLDLPATDLTREFLTAFDHHDKRLGAVREDVFKGLRETPVVWTDKHGGFWVVSGYDEARYVMQSYDLFATAPSVNIPPGLGQRRPMLPLEVDPPLQMRYRSPLAPVFAPQRMRELKVQIEQLAHELLDGFIERGKGDFFNEFADPLPVAIFTRLMGLPEEDTPKFNHWKKVLLHGHADDPDGTVRAAAGDDLSAYLTGLIRARRAEPRDDLLTLLVQAETEGGPLDDDEILDITFLLFVAGLDTISSSIGLQVLFLATHPEYRDLLVEDPSRIPNAVEELLRTNSLILLARTATQDTDLFGSPVKKGDRILVNTITANLDGREFPDADHVDLTREPNRHIAFGAGPHRCPGSHLARIELEIVHRVLHERMPDYRLDPDAAISFHFGSVAGLDTLPLLWGAEA
ncbi:MAG: Cytochrome [Frankiales bacterium]|nr:Cytochrome [Frankiales bacterium]